MNKKRKEFLDRLENSMRISFHGDSIEEVAENVFLQYIETTDEKQIESEVKSLIVILDDRLEMLEPMHFESKYYEDKTRSEVLGTMVKEYKWAIEVCEFLLRHYFEPSANW